MSATISAITSSTWYTSAINSASSIGGYIQWAAANAWSGAAGATNWALHTAMPAIGQGISLASSAALEGLSWTVYTGLPAAANGTLYALTQLFHAILAAPFVAIRGAQMLWASYPIQTALIALTCVGARSGVDMVETQPRIQHLPLKGRVMARFISAMAITGVAVSFGGLLGLTFTSYKLYAVALTLFAAIDSKTRTFLQNAINQREAGTWNTVPLFVQMPGNTAQAFTDFDLERYIFSGENTAEGAFLLEQAKRFQVRPGGSIELGEWMTKLNPRNEGQKAYALALWMHLVETHGPLEAQFDTDLTVRYNHTTWDHTIQVQSHQEEEDVAAAFDRPLPAGLIRAHSADDLNAEMNDVDAPIDTLVQERPTRTRSADDLNA